MSIDERLQRNIGKIFTEWESRARREVASAFGVTSLLMKDHFPSFFDQLAKALSTPNEKTTLRVIEDREEALKFIKEHGRSRASLLYTLAEVILELNIMKHVILDVLEEEALPIEDRNRILNVFDQAVSDAAVNFAAIQNQINEQFALTLVHDLRTPISVAKMGARLIKNDSAISEQTLRVAGKIDKNMDRVESMLKELLDVSRIRAGIGLAFDFEEVRLDEVVTEIVQEMNEIYGERCELRGCGPTTGKWNRDGLRRIVENLTVNALKYGNDNTPVAITISQNATHAILAIHNEGNPIPLKDQPRLFEKFLRADTATSKTGWGLGLALVSGMVTAHSGTVRVESSPATGTDFIVELPKKR